jgi:hypothetical protein
MSNSLRPIRVFKPEDRFQLKGRGTLWLGPCPFCWDKSSLAAWDGEWLISHPDADHTKTYRVIGVESFAMPKICPGAPIGLLFEEWPDDPKEQTRQSRIDV